MDELRRVREVARGAPGPDPERKARARSELLQLAEQEASARDAAPPVAARRAGWFETLRERWLRPAPAVGLAATALLAVVGAGVLLSEPGTEPGIEPAPQVADPEVSSEEDPREVDPGEVEIAPDEGTIALAASCTDPESGLTVAYPDDWFTPQEGEAGACRFFGEETFDVDAAVGGQPLADLEVRVEPVTLEELLDDELGVDETARERRELADRTTVRQRLVTTGEGALPEGSWIERYLIDLGDETAILTVQDDDEAVLDARRDLLEEMARGLEVGDDP